MPAGGAHSKAHLTLKQGLIELKLLFRSILNGLGTLSAKIKLLKLSLNAKVILIAKTWDKMVPALWAVSVFWSTCVGGLGVGLLLSCGEDWVWLMKVESCRLTFEKKGRHGLLVLLRTLMVLKIGELLSVEGGSHTVNWLVEDLSAYWVVSVNYWLLSWHVVGRWVRLKPIAGELLFLLVISSRNYVILVTTRGLDWFCEARLACCYSND